MSVISGTSTSAWRPSASASAIARRYTSVFPLPVTPCSRKRSRGACAHRRADRRARLRLLRRQLGRGCRPFGQRACRARSGAPRARRGLAQPRLEQPLSGPRRERVGAEARAPQQRGAARPLRQALEHPAQLALRGARAQRLAAARGGGEGGRGTRGRAGRKRRGEGEAERAERVLRSGAQHVEQRRRDRGRGVEHELDLAQLARAGRRRAVERDDDTGQRAPTGAHAHATSDQGLACQPLGNGVVEGAIDREGERHARRPRGRRRRRGEEIEGHGGSVPIGRAQPDRPPRRSSSQLRVAGTFASVYRPETPLTGSVWDALAAPLLALAPARRRRILVLGLGGGSAARLARLLAPRARIVGVEIDPEIVALARRWFGLGELGLEVVQEDASHFLDRCRERFDAVLEDVFIGRGRAVRKPRWMLESGLARAATRVAAGGVLASNALDEAPAVARLVVAAFPRALAIRIADFDNRVLVGGGVPLAARSLRAAVAASPILAPSAAKLSFRTL